MRLKSLFLLTYMIAAALSAVAQSTAPDDVIVLNSWRVHAGDNMNWAAPDFDDSAWPAAGAPKLDQINDHTSGYSWDRAAAWLPAELEGRPLAISFGAIDEVYEVYVNGVSVGRFGQWRPSPASHWDRNETFFIPAEALNGARVEIALRRWRGKSSTSQFPFFTFGTARFRRDPELGLASTVSARTSLWISAGIVRNLPWTLCLFSMFALGCIAFALFSAQRQRIEYLLLGLYGTALPISTFLGGILAADPLIMRRSPGSALTDLIYFIAEAGLPLLFLSRISLRFRRWLELGFVLTLLIAVFTALALLNPAISTGNSFSYLLTFLPLPFILLAAVGLLIEQKAGPAAIAIAFILQIVAGLLVNGVAALLGWPDPRFLPLGPFEIDIRAISQVLVILVTLIVLYLRFRDEQLHQVELAQEMAAGRNVQQYLIPDHLPETPGLTIASEYHPAREVGGDFFQVLPHSDGSTLIVVGDMAGHGLQAGMLATLIVGAIRSMAEFTTEPEHILSLLNKRMQGRGLATCLALRIDRDGAVTLANAGHLPPYLNGREMELEGALPLGAIPGIEYSAQHFQLAAGDRLMLMTDGIAEAQNEQGLLFGFDRIGTMLRAGFSPTTLASAAQSFGQQDDITLLTVERMATATAS